MATNFVGELAKISIYPPPPFIVLALHDGLEDRNADGRHDMAMSRLRWIEN